MAKKDKKHRAPHQTVCCLPESPGPANFTNHCRLTVGNRRQVSHFYNFRNWEGRPEGGIQLTKGGNSTNKQQPQTMKPGTGPLNNLKVSESAMKKSGGLTWSAKFVEDPESSSWSDLELPSLSSITRSIGIFPFKQLMYRWQKLSHNSWTWKQQQEW